MTIPTESYAPKRYDEFPLVTAILRTHNDYAGFLSRAMASIKAQTLDPALLEVIVAHDGPPSDEFLAQLETTTKTLACPGRLLATERAYGYYAAPSNFATVHARGHYIAYLDVDNEWRPKHLAGLLQTVRTPGLHGWNHFAYSRREYVVDSEDCDPSLPRGPSELVPWTQQTINILRQGPMNNFIDSSDFLISRGALYYLADLTGVIWNPARDRFGDWELFARLSQCGIRGKAVDQLTHVYHWHGKNLQITRPDTGFVTPLALSDFETLREKGLINAAPEEPAE